MKKLEWWMWVGVLMPIIASIYSFYVGIISLKYGFGELNIMLPLFLIPVSVMIYKSSLKEMRKSLD